MTAQNPPPAELGSLDALGALLLARGHEQYTGEAVTHLEHALQCATLAQQAGAGDALIAAALLHDIGHLVHGLPGTPSADGLDDCHEQLGAATLARWLPPEVCEPVRLHVAAKRALALDAAYLRVLSEDSQRSLALQGGPMTPAERSAFLAQPFAAQAIRLRHWDDGGKTPQLATPGFADFWPLVLRCAVVG